MSLEGILRASQGDIREAIWWIIAIVVLWVAARIVYAFIQDNEGISREEAAGTKIVINGVGVVAVLIVIIVTAIWIINTAGQNSIPRKDIDHSGIYQQMDENAGKK